MLDRERLAVEAGYLVVPTEGAAIRVDRGFIFVGHRAHPELVAAVLDQVLARAAEGDDEGESLDLAGAGLSLVVHHTDPSL